MRGGNSKLAGRQLLGFLALCGLGASGWLVDGAWPSLLPVDARQAIDDLLMALLLGALGWRSLARGRVWTRAGGKLALGSVLLLGVPSTLAETALRGAPEVTVAVMFALAPVMIAVLLANFELAGAEATGASGLLGPALAGFAGVLMLLPLATPASAREVGFESVAALGVLIAAVAGVWMYGLLREFAVVEAAAVCCAANALYFLLTFAVAALIPGAAAVPAGEGWSWSAVGVESLKAVCFNLPQVLILIWLLRDVTPGRFAARYLVVPLLTVIEGYVMLWPGWSVRAFGGAALVAFAAWRLLMGAREEEPGLVLR